MKSHFGNLRSAWLSGLTALAVSIGPAVPGSAQVVVDAPCPVAVQAYRIEYQTVFEEHQITSYKVEYETVYDERQVVVQKPVMETHMQERRYTVQRPVAETSEREERFTVMKPVTETHIEDRSYDRVRDVEVHAAKLEDAFLALTTPHGTQGENR